MPIDVDLPRPKIVVFFSGFVITRIKAGNPVAEVGAHADSDCHQPKISVKKITASGPRSLENLVFDIDKDIELKVEQTTRTKIEEFPLDPNVRKSFDRKAGTGDPDDFRWFVDLDTDLFKGENLTVTPGKLKPIFRINNAVFYTATRTKAPMKIKRPGTGELVPFGLAAEQIAANIYFDKPESKAVLRNGISEILTIDQTDPGASYLIEFNCECHRQIQVSDFPLVYDVIGSKLPDDKKIDFQGEKKLSGSFAECCEVPCFGGNLREI